MRCLGLGFEGQVHPNLVRNRVQGLDLNREENVGRVTAEIVRHLQRVLPHRW